MIRIRFASLLLGVAVLAPACSTTRDYGYERAVYAPRYVAYDEGFRHGLVDGRWSGHRDFGKPYRRSFWDDGRYGRGDHGYRSHYGARSEYADGYRAGYQRGYLERREEERHDSRR